MKQTERTVWRRPSPAADPRPPAGPPVATQRNLSSRFQRNFTQLGLSVDDPIHQGAPAEAKYRTDKPTVDPDLMRIDAVADFIPLFLKVRKINVTLKDPRAKWIEWQLIDPQGRSLPVGFETKAGDADATSRPFELSKATFTPTYVPGQYGLRCTAYDETDRPILRADRDFHVLATDQRNSGVPTGAMYFSKYNNVGAFGRSGIDPGYDYQLDVEVGFFPDETVQCNDIVMMQTVQVLKADGSVTDPSKAKVFAERTTTAQWRIDFKKADLTPYYLTRTNLSGLPEDAPDAGKVGKGGRNRSEATSIDEPAGTDPSIWRYETCAVCRSGSEIGQVYGCATWGFTADKEDNLDLMPRSFSAWPTQQFLDATAKWNLWAAQSPNRVPVPELKQP